ncbi:hypothetical protein [Ciceribacter selenitireducens]|nr:hypothetical protein [Rhizobium sp.]
MPKISIGEQPASVRNAIDRLLKDYRYAETPALAENAISLVVRLYESGICDEDELVELTALSGGKSLDECPRTATLRP